MARATLAGASVRAERTVAGRRPASEEAKERRRRSRRARRVQRLPRGRELETIVRQRMRAVVQRCIRRHVPRERIGEPLLDQYDYWSLRRMGYDAYDPKLRATGEVEERVSCDARTGQVSVERVPVLCDVTESPTWRWWMTLHWKTRLKVSGAWRYILRGLCERQQVAIRNPNFIVEEARAGVHEITGRENVSAVRSAT